MVKAMNNDTTIYACYVKLHKRRYGGVSTAMYQARLGMATKVDGGWSRWFDVLPVCNSRINVQDAINDCSAFAATHKLHILSMADVGRIAVDYRRPAADATTTKWHPDLD